MKLNNSLSFLFLVFITTVAFVGCGGDDEPTLSENDYVQLLTNQINEVITPTMENYQSEMANFQTAANGFSSDVTESKLTALREAYRKAYLSYQPVAVHDYYATSNQDLVNTTNLYPIDLTVLDQLIADESYDFGTVNHERANGFPALDYMLYGNDDVVAYFNSDPKRLTFITKLVESMKAKSDALVERWGGTLVDNFIGNGGTALGSSISVQLNESIVYYEDHVRENKVGIPIGLLGPNDSPIPADATKIEAYYQSIAEGNDGFALQLLKAAVEEMEDYYLGETASGENGQGYDDLLTAISQSSIDTDIKAQFEKIYTEIDSRTEISGDQDLYNSVQELVTILKSDLFSVLNVQDADGSNDGD